MTSERWQQIERLYHSALERERDDRAVFLQQACGGDDGLRQEVEELLAHDAAGEVLLDRSALGAIAAEMLDQQDGGSVVGRQLGSYRVIALLGRGGMGVVYRAHDTKLGRYVAIKVLPRAFVNDPERLARFQREASVLAALNHPNIATIHGLEEVDKTHALVMELVEGSTLADRIATGPIPIGETLSYAEQICDALEYAHERGVVHRDLKPANVVITEVGQAKVLDFGLAKRLSSAELAEARLTPKSLTEAGAIVGTLRYMAPETLRGEPADARTDLWAVGAVLYEMATGIAPFHGRTVFELSSVILRGSPQPLPSRLPQGLRAIIERCLAKERAQRYQHAAEVRVALEALQEPAAKPWKFSLRQPMVIAAMVVVLIAAGALGIRGYVRTSRARWAEKVALPKIDQLISSGRLFEAFRLLREAEPYAKPSPLLARAQERLGVATVSIDTTPPRAEIYIRDYNDVEKDRGSTGWVLLGTSPLKTQEFPINGIYRFRAVKEGYTTVERSVETDLNRSINLPLHERNVTPPGMVWVVAGYTPRQIASVEVSGYWIDKYEVTNREFKRFVDSGGYQNREYWKVPFIQDGRTLSWEQAMAQFRDATGRPGPSTWQLGTYAEGTADFPVGGVSWYEAMAYARFLGKSLPTVYHWFRAADFGVYSEILGLSNFSGRGPAPVGSYSGLGPFGTYDMAGNLKEWTLNSDLAGDHRYILGGAWNEPRYVYSARDARKPFDRLATFGFRCVRYDSPVPEVLAGPYRLASRDRSRPRPVDDETFDVYVRLHSYDKTDLQPSVEAADNTSPYWRMEKVTFRAAYGDENERVIARLYLPKGFAPPYQVVMYFPGADALTARSPEELQDNPFEFVIRSGRALMFPSYNGTLERGPGAFYYRLGEPNKWTEMNLQWSKDLGRSLDYLETRKDIDNEKVAFCGASMGAAMGPRLIAVEPRIKTAVLLSGGVWTALPSEVDPWNYAPHVKIPVLMLNGRDDFVFPVETSQIPLFQALGTPAKDKQHVLFDGGHANLLGRPELMKEVLNWLDKYLGPVQSRP